MYGILKKTLLNIFETALNKDVENEEGLVIPAYKDDWGSQEIKDLQIYVTDGLYHDETVLCVIINGTCYDVTVKLSRCNYNKT